MLSEIKVSGHSGVAVIDIEGVIGVPEKMQFDHPGQRIATYERFTLSLREIEAIRASEVVVNIRSTGGDVNDALLIYEALTSLPDAHITTRCYGYVASAATIIAQAASAGAREISANTLYLIHCSESAAEGNSGSMSRVKELLDKTDSRIAGIYAARSGRDASGFAALMGENGGKGRWLSAEEAVAAGLADVVREQPVGNCGLEINSAVEIARMLGIAMMPGMEAPPVGSAPEDAGLGTCAAEDEKHRFWRVLREVLAKLFSTPADESDQGAVTAQIVPEEQVTDAVEAEAIEVRRRREAQKKAAPTRTAPREDPSHEGRSYSPNARAYYEDSLSLRAAR